MVGNKLLQEMIGLTCHYRYPMLEIQEVDSHPWIRMDTHGIHEYPLEMDIHCFQALYTHEICVTVCVNSFVQAWILFGVTLGSVLDALGLP